MGTRCLTRVFDGKEELLCIYRHFDGYPSAQGADITAILKDRRVVNGMSGDPNELNGAGQVATHLVIKLSERAKIDICPTGTKEVWEEYEYHVLVPSLDAIDAKHRTEKFGDPRGLPIHVRAFAVRKGRVLSELPSDNEEAAPHNEGEPASATGAATP